MAKTYDLRLSPLTLGGQLIEGFGASAALTITFDSPLITKQVGVDGALTVSRTNNNHAVATITVMETSLSYKKLGGMLKAQQAPGSILPLPFMFLDTITGEEISAEYAIFEGRPEISKSGESGERVFTLALENPTVVYGGLLS